MSTRGYWGQSQPFSNQALTIGKYPGTINNVWYLAPQGNGPRGSFATFAALSPNLRSRDLIILIGVLREQAITPTGVGDVTIVGGANKPRQATTAGTPNYAGASWLAPTSPTALTPLLEIREQGWQLVNFQMAPVASSACVRLTRTAGAAYKGASHTSLSGMYFSGGGSLGIGVEDNGGCAAVLIEGSRFESQGDSAILSLNTAVAVPLSWMIKGNKFQQNLNDIKMSLSYAEIEGNDFMTAGSGATNKVISTTFIATQGGNNHIRLNQFSNTEAEIAPANGYTGAATDTWMNYVNNQAALAFGQPA